MTKPEHLNTQLASIADKDWQTLFDFIPEIKAAKSFGTLVGAEKHQDGSIAFPYWKEGELVSKFFNVTYMLGLVIAYDWASWHEGIAILNEKHEAIDELDLEHLCKLLTIIIRSDKFCEGYLLNCFQSGVVLKVVETMQVKFQDAPIGAMRA